MTSNAKPEGAVGASADDQRCDVCGRGYSEDLGHLTGERGPAACYRLGYERLYIQNAALSDALEVLLDDVKRPTDASIAAHAALRLAGRLP